MSFTAEATFARNDRQLRVWGEEKQRKLHDTRALVLGGGTLSDMVLAGMAGLGIGNIEIMNNDRSNSRRSFLASNIRLEYLAEETTETLRRINPYITINRMTSVFSEGLLDFIRCKPDIIIETNNDGELKKKSLSYASKKNIPYISGYAGYKKSSVITYNGKNEEEILSLLPKEKNQGSVPSGVAGGIILQELIKNIFQDSREEDTEEEVIYNQDSSTLNSNESDLEGRMAFTKRAKILVAGAGGIGTYVSLNLALSEFEKIDILDFDEIQETNLNRQILFYDKIGEPKAKTLLERISKLKRMKGRSFYQERFKIGEDSQDFLKKENYDLIFGCLDNKRARYFLNLAAKELDIPYVDGSTSSSSGTVEVYVPGHTSCINCKKNIDLEEEVRNSCAEAAPSVVMPNMVVGSLMVGVAKNILAKRNTNYNRITYDKDNPKKIKSQPPRKSRRECDC